MYSYPLYPSFPALCSFVRLCSVGLRRDEKCQFSIRWNSFHILFVITDRHYLSQQQQRRRPFLLLVRFSPTSSSSFAAQAAEVQAGGDSAALCEPLLFPGGALHIQRPHSKTLPLRPPEPLTDPPAAATSYRFPPPTKVSHCMCDGFGGRTRGPSGEIDRPGVVSVKVIHFALYSNCTGQQQHIHNTDMIIMYLII